MKLCDICGEPILDYEDRHQPHEPGCPNTSEVHTVDCTCDLNTHPWCCPECNPKEKK